MSLYTIVGGVGFQIWGDGVSTSFTYDVSNYPFSIPFNKTFPDSITLPSFFVAKEDGSGPDPSYTAVISMSKSQVTVIFNKPLNNHPVPPPASGAGSAYISISFVFNG